MRVGVIQYPGSNADYDALHVLRDVLRWDARYVFHKEQSLAGCDAVVVPGGFSYGDYLRPGAIARVSPITAALIEFAQSGGPVLGICNGFQILTELGLLPGALTRNRHLRFECRDVFVRCEQAGVFTPSAGTVLRLPIAHADGRFVVDERGLSELEDRGQIALRYCDAQGGVRDVDNPNGSVSNIAGIYNEAKNVLGLMPHPERASEALVGNEDGRVMFAALAAAWSASSEGAS